VNGRGCEGREREEREREVKWQERERREKLMCPMRESGCECVSSSYEREAVKEEREKS
jgi:hypothetical protein